MARNTQHPFTAMNATIGVAGILFGLISGYILGAGRTSPAPAVQAATSAALPSDHPTTVANESELQAYRDILEADPKNAKAAVELANRLYDAGRYTEAIPFYRQALAIEPGNANISTDLATALYYSGKTDDALAQLDASLTIDPTHAQTLFNLGVVKRDGKRDARGAADAWERLLNAHPDYPDAARVKSMLAQARS
jgi:cytochrome c-type biogenesis protein CcmH/NrfG